MKTSLEVVVMQLAKEVFSEGEYERFAALVALRNDCNPRLRALVNLELLRTSERLETLLDARQTQRSTAK